MFFFICKKIKDKKSNLLNQKSNNKKIKNNTSDLSSQIKPNQTIKDQNLKQSNKNQKVQNNSLSPGLQNKKIAKILTNNYKLLEKILQGKETPLELIKKLHKKIPNISESKFKKLLESNVFLCNLSMKYDFLSDIIFDNIAESDFESIITQINGESIYKLLKNPKMKLNINILTTHPVYNSVLNKNINQMKPITSILLNYNIITKEAYKLYQYKEINSGYLSDFLMVYEESTYNNDMTYIVYHFIYLLEKYDSNENLHLIQEYVNNMMHYFSNSHLGSKLEAALIKYLSRLDVSKLSTSAISIIEYIIEKKDQLSQYSSKKIEYIKDLLRLKMIIYKIKLSNYSSSSLKLLTNMIKDVGYDLEIRKKAVEIYNIIISEIIPDQFINILKMNKQNLCSR